VIRRVIAVLAVGAVASCATPGGGAGKSPGAPSAESVASNPSDFPGLTKCPQSGSYESYINQEQTSAPDQYASDKSRLENLKATGLDDSYVVVYAANTGDCVTVASSDSPPTGKVAQVYVFRFKDSTSAATNYKTDANEINLTDTDIGNLKTAGATVKKGTESGLGENSVVVATDLQGSKLYLAYWQNMRFEVLVAALNMGSDVDAASKINGRIH
jgi:hypothetical protein